MTKSIKSIKNTDNLEQKISDKILDITESQNILSQCKTEFQMAKDTMATRWLTWHTYLKLYNNQKRDREAIGNNLLYTLFNTLLAFLYFDKLTVTFEPRDSGDIERCELFTHLAKFDFDEMGMAKKKYDILWDSLFFGNGFYYIGPLDKDTKTPQIDIIDPFTIYVDPFAISIQNARFIAIERAMTKTEMIAKGFKNVDKLGVVNRDTQYKQADEARKEAKNEVSQTEPSDYENKQYIVLEWFTIRHGKKVRFFTDFNCTLLLTDIKPLPYKDGEFPIVVQSFSPIPHEFWGLSVPDLIEDKQRANAILLNLGLKMEESKLYPRYLFDRNAILNIQDLKNPAFNKYIPVEAGNRSVRDIIAPLEQVSITNSTTVLYELLRDASERTLGTTQLRQGIVSSGRRTATELQLAAVNADTRNSLAAKLFTLSEIEFWTKWLRRYQQWKELAKGKIVRIQGALGVRFETLETSTFDFNSDPDIKIESANVSLQKKMFERQALIDMAQLVLDASSPNAAKRYYKRKLLQLSDFNKDEIDQILPPTFDELRAEEENKLLEKGKLPVIEPDDDHYTHIMIHNIVPVNETTKNVLIAHIQAHKTAFLEERKKEKQKEKQMEKQVEKAQAQSIEQILGLSELTRKPPSPGQMPLQTPEVPISEMITPEQLTENRNNNSVPPELIV